MTEAACEWVPGMYCEDCDACVEVRPEFDVGTDLRLARRKHAEEHAARGEPEPVLVEAPRCLAHGVRMVCMRDKAATREAAYGALVRAMARRAVTASPNRVEWAWEAAQAAALWLSAKDVPAAELMRRVGDVVAFSPNAYNDARPPEGLLGAELVASLARGWLAQDVARAAFDLVSKADARVP